MNKDPRLLADIEESLLQYLLVRYGLDNSRARFKVLDIERDLRDYAESRSNTLFPEQRSLHLTVRGWMILFPAYPVWYEVKALSDRDMRHLRLAQPAMPPQSSVIRRYVEDVGKTGRDSLVWVLHPPRVRAMKVEDLAVVHLGPIQSVEPGSHTQVIMPGGLIVCIQPLHALLAYLDERNPPEDWLASATRAGWDEPCAHHNPSI